MRVLFLALLLLVQARVSTADPSCDDVSRLRRPVTEIEITASYLDRSGKPMPEGRSLSRIAYSADQRKVSITTTSPLAPNSRGITECRYDKKHRLVKETETDYDGRDVVERTTTSYEYSGRVSIAKSDGRKTYLYHDANGNVVRGMARGPSKYYEEDIEYKYSDDRVEVRRMWSETDVSGEQLNVYDKRGNLTRSEANGGGLIEEWTYEFDDLGNWIKRVGTFVGYGAGELSRAIETRRIQYR